MNAGESKTESSLLEAQEMRRLPAVLGMRDLIVLLVLIVLFIPNILTAQLAGPTAFLYWMLALFTFILPSAFVIQWLARRFPGQGAPYFWAIRILGAKWSFLAAFCAWWPGTIAIIATAEVGIYTIQYLAPTWFTTPVEHFLAMMAVLIVSTAAACLPLRWLKHILFGFAALLLLLYSTRYSWHLVASQQSCSGSTIS
jgi:amino acid transporter